VFHTDSSNELAGPQESGIQMEAYFTHSSIKLKQFCIISLFTWLHKRVVWFDVVVIFVVRTPNYVFDLTTYSSNKMK